MTVETNQKTKNEKIATAFWDCLQELAIQDGLISLNEKAFRGRRDKGSARKRKVTKTEAAEFLGRHPKDFHRRYFFQTRQGKHLEWITLFGALLSSDKGWIALGSINRRNLIRRAFEKTATQLLNEAGRKIEKFPVEELSLLEIYNRIIPNEIIENLVFSFTVANSPALPENLKKNVKLFLVSKFAPYIDLEIASEILENWLPVGYDIAQSLKINEPEIQRVRAAGNTE